jgi:hypothetical protein
VTTAIDASVLVAELLPWHEHDGAARAALRTLLRNVATGTKPILPAHARLEAYSVMTRLPAADAVRLPLPQLACFQGAP